ncbi:MAG: DUF1361 domain-containing protein [Patescibacteria group bacterium]|nr:DUF1361 domain-containing protein [Patescibacteria group bacterium]
MWNLFLAWIPLVLSYILISYLKRHAWSSWMGIFLTFLWLVFLPNSFYMITDYIHLQIVPATAVLYFAISFTGIIFNAIFLGFLSVYFIHQELKKRIRRIWADFYLVLIFLACGYAVYIGRILRWNTWDIVLNPGGLIFDISNQFIKLNDLSMATITTLMIFVFLLGLYSILYNGIRFLLIDLNKSKESKDGSA